MFEYKNIKIDRDGVEGRTLIGYAAEFGNRDKVGDTIEPGAFKKTISEGGAKIKVFYNHYKPLGVPIAMREDSKGLYTESKISKTQQGDEVLELIKDGVITEMSIAYETLQSEPDRPSGRRLKELRLIIAFILALTSRILNGFVI